MDNKNANTKREFITKAFDSGRYDDNFVITSRKLISNSKNLDKILIDIECYPQSKAGKAHLYVDTCLKTVQQYDNPVMVTFTSRYPLSADEIKKRYVETINNVSRKLFKKAYQRYNKRVAAVAFVEGDEITQRHIHAVLDMPVQKGLNHSQLKSMLEDHWYKTAGMIKYDILSDETDLADVVSYIAKKKGKESFSDIHDAFVI